MKSKIGIIVLTSLLFLSSCKKKDVNYKMNLATADSLFKAENYEEAKAYYSSILKKNPKDKVVKKKMAEVTSLLSKDKKEMRFKKLKLEADDLFKVENYSEANALYEKALSIMPHNEEVQNRLKDIEFLKTKINDEIATSQSDIQSNSNGDSTYYIIVGCFMHKNNAVNLNKKLIARGLDSRMFSLGNLTAVTYSSYSTINKAYNNLERVVEDSLEDAAWVLKK